MRDKATQQLLIEYHQVSLCCHLITHLETIRYCFRISYINLWPRYWLSSIINQCKIIGHMLRSLKKINGEQTRRVFAFCLLGHHTWPVECRNPIRVPYLVLQKKLVGGEVRLVSIISSVQKVNGDRSRLVLVFSQWRTKLDPWKGRAQQHRVKLFEAQ